MKCRRIRHLLLDFVDGRGNEALHAEVDRHVAECAECEKFASEMTRSLALLRRVPLAPLDENFNWKVRLAIHRAEKAGAKREVSSGAWVRTWNLRYAVSAGVGFALVLLAGMAVVQDVRSPWRPTGALVSRGGEPQPSRSQLVRSQPDRRGWESAAPSRDRAGEQRARSGPQLVSDAGAGAQREDRMSLRGAIDPYAQEGAIDSLIDARLLGMTPELRARFIQRQIHRLQSQLESQYATKP